MPEAQTLLLFSLAVLGLLLAPGPNMAYLLAQGLAQGPRAGVAAALGILCADLLMTLLAASGLTAVLVSWPATFDVLRIGGALYLLWLALRAWRASAAPAASDEPMARALPEIVGQACANSLLNPKALVFYLVFLPQFADPARGSLAGQFAVLGVLLSVEAFAFHALLGGFSGTVGRRLAGAGTRRALVRLQSVVFIALAFRLFLLQGP